MCKTDYGGGGGKTVPKIDYVICERPLMLDVEKFYGEARGVKVITYYMYRSYSLASIGGLCRY